MNVLENVKQFQKYIGSRQTDKPLDQVDKANSKVQHIYILQVHANYIK